MKKPFFLILFCTLLLTVVSCGDNSHSQPPLASGSVIVADETIPDVAPNISGIVTSICYGREGSVLLVEIPDENKKYVNNNVYVTVTSKTIVQDSDKKDYRSYDTDKRILPGDTVSVWYSGNATGTSPDYAVAQGVRVTAHMEELLLTVRLNHVEIMASPSEGEVTSTDIRPLLYGSYLQTYLSSSETVLSMSFLKNPTNLSVAAVPVTAENSTTYHFTCNTDAMTCSIPANLVPGTYTVNVKAEYPEGADNYIFTLCVQ